MYPRYSLLLIVLLHMTVLRSQELWNEGHSPDWTAQDVNGEQHTLYQYLDQGYTVLLDFSATWCSPCWDVHTAGWLDSLHNEYGPGSAEPKYVVLMIELDTSTDLADLQGTGDQTMGDWITGTPYPMIDDASIAEIYGVQGFPFMLRICPNRMVAPLGGDLLNMTTAYARERLDLCEPYIANTTNDLAALYSQPGFTCSGASVELTARIQNVGTSPVTNAMIEAWGYTGSYGDTLLGATAWAGELDTYQEEVVPVCVWTPTDGSYMEVNTIRMRVISNDDRPENNESAHMVSASDRVASSTDVTLTFLTDDNGWQSAWELHDVNDQIIAYSYGGYEDNTIYEITWSLTDGACYTLLMLDYGGDGLQSPAYFQLSSGGEVLYHGPEVQSNAWWRHFQVDTHVGLIELTENDELFLTPVPADQFVTVSVPIDNAIGVLRLLDVQGHELARVPVQCANIELPLSKLANGAYILIFENDSARITGRLLVAH